MAMKLVDADVLDADLTSVADSIRAKTGGADTLAFPSGFVSAVDSIESGGGADEALAEVESMMTVNFSGESYTNYSNMFYGMVYMNEVPMRILANIENGDEFSYMFYRCGGLTEIPELNTVAGKNFGYMFEYCSSLKTVGGINITNATYLYNMFYNCDELENITFNGFIKRRDLNLSSCTKLTHDSLMSAINALYDWASEGSTSTYTVTLGSTNLAKLTDAEKAIATQRGWTLA